MAAVELGSTPLFSDANLQGYWKLEANGNDSGPNGYNLSGVNTPTFVTGKFGNGTDLESGSTQYFEIADASCANLEISGSQTWGAWVKPETETGLKGILCKGNSKRLWVNNSVYTFDLSGLTTNSAVTSSVSPVSGSWDFVVGVYDSANSKLKIFVNGTKTEVTSSGSATDTNSLFHIGNQVAHNIPYDGIVDDAFVFNRALTDSEVSNLYTGNFSSGSFFNLF